MMISSREQQENSGTYARRRENPRLFRTWDESCQLQNINLIRLFGTGNISLLKSIRAMAKQLMPHWLELKPCPAAQHISSLLGHKIDPKIELPDYVWQIADMAAQMAFNEAANPCPSTRAGGTYPIKVTQK